MFDERKVEDSSNFFRLKVSASSAISLAEICDVFMLWAFISDPYFMGLFIYWASWACHVFQSNTHFSTIIFIFVIGWTLVDIYTYSSEKSNTS